MLPTLCATHTAYLCVLRPSICWPIRLRHARANALLDRGRRELIARESLDLFKRTWTSLASQKSILIRKYFLSDESPHLRIAERRPYEIDDVL